MLRVLEESTSFLEGELRKRGVVTEQGLAKLRDDALSDTSDLLLPTTNNWCVCVCARVYEEKQQHSTHQNDKFAHIHT